MPDIDEREELRLAEVDIRRINAQIAYEHERLGIEREYNRTGWSNNAGVRELRLCVLSRMLEQALNVRSENLRRIRGLAEALKGPQIGV